MPNKVDISSRCFFISFHIYHSLFFTIDESKVGQVAEEASCNTLYTLIYLN